MTELAGALVFGPESSEEDEFASAELLPVPSVPVPASILMAQDDPVIPFASFEHWQLPAQARLEIARWGGHCGFLENLRGDGFAERWVARRLASTIA